MKGERKVTSRRTEREVKPGIPLLDKVGTVGRAIDERDGDLFLHWDTCLAAPSEDKVTVGIMSVAMWPASAQELTWSP